MKSKQVLLVKIIFAALMCNAMGVTARSPYITGLFGEEPREYPDKYTEPCSDPDSLDHDDVDHEE